jgi:plastocyanin
VFDVDALPSGMYYFDCVTHNVGMSGIFIVEKRAFTGEADF